MPQRNFPAFDCDNFTETCDALHAYTQVIGDWRAACLPRRKHWWHGSVYPSVRGITTGLIHSDVDFELELDLQADRLNARIAGGCTLNESLAGRSGYELAEVVANFLLDQGIEPALVPKIRQDENHEVETSVYSAEIAKNLGTVLRSISAAMTTFRSSIAEETSPIQVWPHHFDMAMLWLPGEKIPGMDPADEETSEKQMNFGFALGDAIISEPYFYITATPLPDELRGLSLPDGAYWHNEGFRGVVLPYKKLMEESNPLCFLISLWNRLLAAGRHTMLENTH